MAWSSLDIAWRSLVVAHPLDTPKPPLTFRGPEDLWSYAAISDPLPEASGYIRVQLAASGGRIGVALSVPNGSVFLSQELDVAPNDGEQELYFRRGAGEGPACIILRNYGEAASSGRLIAAAAGTFADLPSKRTARIAGPAAVVDASGLTISPSNVARADEPMQPISLGNTCEVKLHVSRALQYRFREDISAGKFRLMMAPPNRSRDIFGWDLFDWQGTPLNTLIHYFNADFKGLYEREDLVTNGFNVVNRRTGAEHRHDYEVLKLWSDPVTDALIDSGYAEAKRQFGAMVEAFERRLSEPGPFLYVHTCEDFPSEYSTRVLLQKLASRSPDHRFHLLLVGFADEDHDLSALSDQVSKAYRPRPAPGANLFDWGGDYEAWDSALAPFKLRLPGSPH